jgi:hypothetical protein
MRVVKGCHLLFLFSLTLGLFFAEFPESCSLTDDVSNDFVEAAFAPVSIRMEIAPRDLFFERRITLVEESIRTLPVVPSIEPASFSGPDLLRLLSIQRK